MSHHEFASTTIQSHCWGCNKFADNLEMDIHAGIPINKYSGTDTAVFTGCFTNDYAELLQADLEAEQRHAALGVSPAILANRISWFFNFTGTSLNTDTACSSSLVALHLACQDLRVGNCSMALVRGANLVFHPNFMKLFADGNFLGKDGRSLSFDQRANGYGRGDGHVKANIGHFEGASGLAGVIKTVLALEKGIIPLIADLAHLNSKIDADRLHLVVNSFGFGGTNAVVVLDDAYHHLQAPGIAAFHRTLSSLPLVNGSIVSMSTTNGIDIQKGPEGKSRATQPMLLVWSGAVDISMQARPWHLLDGSKGTASNIMVASVRMDERFKDSPEMAYKTLRAAVKFTLVEQLATPQPIHVIGGSDLRKAMADLQSGGVVGKRVIQLDPEHVFMANMITRPKHPFVVNATYVILGGFG
ncbi:thiolase-like protein [Hypoxylon argillaceum]|nr:thiolase-like protein [Hypoxylon argillaceum]